MLLYEYQAKALLQRFHVPSPIWYLIESQRDIDDVLRRFGLQEGVVKAQVHVGGRGKAGAVRRENSVEALRRACQEILGMKIVNRQTGEDGCIAHKVIVTPAVSIEKEFYLALVLDRKTASHILIASSRGGVEIEEVMKEMPQAVFRETISENNCLHRFQLRRLMSHLEVERNLQDGFIRLVDGLVRAYFYFDATLIEINPLAITEDKTLLALDMKMAIDDNGLFRQKEMPYFCDTSTLSQEEREAHGLGLSYVPTKGSIGCVVNGAGLAMATMDLIQFWGGSAANFLDVGGGATEEKVIHGFRIVLSDPHVRVVFVNIFGGIMNCETIARALVKSVERIQRPLPHIVLRMEGTNVQAARAFVQKSGLPIQSASSLDDAARMAVLLCSS